MAYSSLSADIITLPISHFLDCFSLLPKMDPICFWTNTLWRLLLQCSQFACLCSWWHRTGNLQISNVKTIAIGIVNKPKNFILLACSFKVHESSPKFTINGYVVVVMPLWSMTMLLQCPHYQTLRHTCVHVVNDHTNIQFMNIIQIIFLLFLSFVF